MALAPLQTEWDDLGDNHHGRWNSPGCRLVKRSKPDVLLDPMERSGSDILSVVLESAEMNWKNSGTVPEFFQRDVCGKRKRCAGDNSQIETLIAHFSST